MPRLRKPEPIMLSDDELFALMRATHPKVRQWNPRGIELTLLNNAYKTITKEYYARAEEEQRIETELTQINNEYKEIEKYEHTN